MNADFHHGLCNYVQDAWLDSVEVDPSLANKVSTIPKNDDEEKDLSSDDIGKIKRRIANALEPGETVIMLCPSHCYYGLYFLLSYLCEFV